MPVAVLEGEAASRSAAGSSAAAGTSASESSASSESEDEPVVTLEDFDPLDPRGALLNSPRSLAGCAHVGAAPRDMVRKPLSACRHSRAEKEALVQFRFEKLEIKRRQRLRSAKLFRDRLVAADDAQAAATNPDALMEESMSQVAVQLNAERDALVKFELGVAKAERAAQSYKAQIELQLRREHDEMLRQEVRQMRLHGFLAEKDAAIGDWQAQRGAGWQEKQAAQAEARGRQEQARHDARLAQCGREAAKLDRKQQAAAAAGRARDEAHAAMAEARRAAKAEAREARTARLKASLDGEAAKAAAVAAARQAHADALEAGTRQREAFRAQRSQAIGVAAMLHAEKARREEARRTKVRADGLARHAREMREAAAARAAKGAAAAALVARRRGAEAAKQKGLLDAVEAKHAAAEARLVDRQQDRQAFWLEAAEAADAEMDDHLRRADEVEAARQRELRLRVALKSQKQNVRLLTAASERREQALLRQQGSLRSACGGSGRTGGGGVSAEQSLASLNADWTQGWGDVGGDTAAAGPSARFGGMGISPPPSPPLLQFEGLPAGGGGGGGGGSSSSGFLPRMTGTSPVPGSPGSIGAPGTPGGMLRPMTVGTNGTGGGRYSPVRAGPAGGGGVGGVHKAASAKKQQQQQQQPRPEQKHGEPLLPELDTGEAVFSRDQRGLRTRRDTVWQYQRFLKHEHKAGGKWVSVNADDPGDWSDWKSAAHDGTGAKVKRGVHACCRPTLSTPFCRRRRRCCCSLPRPLACSLTRICPLIAPRCCGSGPTRWRVSRRACPRAGLPVAGSGWRKSAIRRAGFTPSALRSPVSQQRFTP
jgi:hypothetical protein